MSQKKLTKLINEELPNGILCTTDLNQQPNAAVVGSARLSDCGELQIALTENRTLANLRVCPKAVYLCSEPGPSPIMWRGARLYLVCDEMVSQGELFEQTVAAVRAQAGDEAAKRIAVVISFKVESVRRLLEI